jgi:SAM-dependent methyltransferase
MTTTDTPTDAIDPQELEAFAERMLGVINDGCLALLTSVGQRVGLFDTLADLPPSASEEIAAAANVDERYAREWLAGMVTGGIVEYDPETCRYRLPPARAASLTTAAGPNNLAHLTQFITMLAEVHEPIVECFHNGGGVGYEAFDDFHRLMAEDSSAVHDALLIDVIVPLAPELPTRLEAGIDVADLGCGSGHAINLLGQAFPASRFAGFDFSEEAIEAARREADEWGLANVHFEVRDVATLDGDAEYDLITAFDAIHDQAHPARVLHRARQLLREDGVFLMVDVQASSRLEENVDHPLATFGYAISTMHCMTVSLAGDGDGLGTFWGEQLASAMLTEAGLGDIEIHHLDEDIWNAYYVARIS